MCDPFRTNLKTIETQEPSRSLFLQIPSFVLTRKRIKVQTPDTVMFDSTSAKPLASKS